MVMGTSEMDVNDDKVAPSKGCEVLKELGGIGDDGNWLHSYA